MFSAAFERSLDPLAYENNWAFVVQETRFGGFCYSDGELLLTAVSRHDKSPFLFVFPPLGDAPRIEQSLLPILAPLRAASMRRVVLRKIPVSHAERFLRSGAFAIIPSDSFVHPRDIPEDVHPQVIISVADTLVLSSSRFLKTRNQINHFVDSHSPDVLSLSAGSVTDVEILVKRWYEAYRGQQARHDHSGTSPHSVVDTTAYTVFARVFGGNCDGSHYFGKLVYVSGEVVGFAFAGRTSSSAASLYCSLALRAFRGAAEFLLQVLLKDLSTAGVEHLNMGGSETVGLFNFKNKFAVTALRPCVDLEFNG